MKALITGASSGIGKEIAILLSEIGYDLVLVSKDKKKLEVVKQITESEKCNVEIIKMDLSSTFNCMKLYNKVKKDDIEIVINNAGFGIHGFFTECKLEKELDMIDLNIKAVQTLTKMFLKDMKEKNHGYILNVASTAAYIPGPLMSSYYASKSYVLNLTEAINLELKKENSLVYVGALAPGPVSTGFQRKAKIKELNDAMPASQVASIAVDEMFNKKRVIIPGFKNKFYVFITRFIPKRMLLEMNFKFQARKMK